MEKRIADHMIIVTGGAGFIGSALAWALNQRGYDDILIVDRLGSSEKWRNLVPLRFSDFLDKDAFLEKLEKGAFGDDIDAILHMGACSSTTEQDADFLMENNVHYTARIAAWQSAHRSCRFIYASSAATYGDGSFGYSEDEARLDRLRPLNMYGYSKHLLDLIALRRGWLRHAVGLKYFNVFGPNEWHKEEMRSVICKAYPRVWDEGKMVLFKSHREGWADGEQERDFLYIKDAVAMTLFFLDNEDKNGLFNIGTGRARTWNDVASALFAAAGKPLDIDYVPMPESIRDKYQYHTCADLARLRAAGCTHACMSLEDAVRDYVHNYLKPSRRLGE
jgi:ADP-L-glycero-D-manno-heptose 6-epimerase